MWLGVRQYRETRECVPVPWCSDEPVIAVVFLIATVHELDKALSSSFNFWKAVRRPLTSTYPVASFSDRFAYQNPRGTTITAWEKQCAPEFDGRNGLVPASEKKKSTSRQPRCRRCGSVTRHRTGPIKTPPLQFLCCLTSFCPDVNIQRPFVKREIPPMGVP